MQQRAMTKWQAALAASWLASAGCSPSSRTPEPTDCAAGDAYQMSPALRTFETAEDDAWFTGADTTGATALPPAAAPNPACGSGGSGGIGDTGGGGGTGGSGGTGGTGGDTTGTGTISTEIKPIEGGGRCGSMNALVLRSAGHTDWGSLFGDWKLASDPGIAFCDTCGPRDATGYEGFALWARSPSGDKAVTILFDTWQTSAAGTTGVDPALVCRVDCNAGSGTRSIDEAGNTTSQSYVSPPGSCGNSFQRVLQLTTQWQLYLLPFDSFYQDLKPNMVKGGPDVAHINGLTLRTAKEATVEIWLDDIAFYKRK